MKVDLHHYEERHSALLCHFLAGCSFNACVQAKDCGGAFEQN